MVVDGYSQDFHVGQKLMIQKLAKDSHQIGKYLRDCQDRYRQEAISAVQRRLLDEGQVGDALNCTPEEFWTRYLLNEDREVMPRGYNSKSEAFNLCLWGPIENLFKPTHRISQLDDSIGAELLCAAVNDGVVNVRVGESETPVVMEGRTPKLIDAFSLAEVLDTYVECEIMVGGMGIQFEGISTITNNNH